MTLIAAVKKAVRRDRFCRKLTGKLLSSDFLRHNWVYNNLHFRWALKRIRSARCSVPSCVHIETTNFCNARCKMCAHGIMKRRKGAMNMHLFEKVIDDAADLGIELVNLQFYGEPFIDKQFFDRVKYAKEKNLTIKFSTNASLLTQSRAKLLIKYGVDEINLALDGFTKETYEEIRAGLSFERVLSNITRLIELKKEMESDVPFLRLNYVNLSENQHEARVFYSYWKDRVDEVIVGYVRNWAGQKEVRGRDSPHLGSLPEKNPCDSLWNEMVVLYDGRVALCCDDYDGKVIMGDLSKQTILEVWCGKQFRAYREAHLKDERQTMLLCAQCRKYSVWWY